ncbi:MAG: DNA polymerase I [Alphaproteobacteria bacterium]|nr:DNA polymerase I [Alphaproteobacteria bacterium]
MPKAQSPKPTLYLIDGSGFIFRAYHALPPLTAPNGTPIGAVSGFVNMLLKLRKDLDSRDASAVARASLEQHPIARSADQAGDHSIYMAVIFDAARQTFRNRIYPDYKAHRPPAPEDLVPQFPIVREATLALGLPAIELADYEADDIIATYAREARAAGFEVVVISSDKDLMQLVGQSVSLYDAMKNKPIGEAEVKEKFGVSPDKVRDVLALMGDSSDNVPGVPGIGPKTAAELIGEYGDLETLLARAHEIKQPKRRETILSSSAQARISYELVGLMEAVPNLPPLESLATRPLDIQIAGEFMQKYGLKAALSRLQNKEGIGDLALGIGKEKQASALSNPQSPIPNASYQTLTSEAALAEWILRARRKGMVAFDTETTSLDSMRTELVGFSLCVEAGEACYVPLLHKGLGMSDLGLGENADLFSSPVPNAQSLIPNQIPLARALELMKPLLEDESVLKIGHNIKFDMHVMARYGITLRAVDDTMLMAYCLHAGEHGQGMDELAEKYLARKTITFDEITGTGKARKRFDEVDIDKATAYAAEDADITMQLHQLFARELFEARLQTLYQTLERPLVPILFAMEERGIKVNPARLAELSKDFETRMFVLEKDIHALAGAEFNVGSPKQLGEILFDALKLPGGKKSAKTGAYSTDNEVLEELAEAGHTIASKVIDWRSLAKLRGTYTDALAQQINPATKRVHTSFAQAITSTGRLSSSDPNLQNIPIRSEEGRKIREAFVADEGCVLVSADYSQIELRLLAHMANIEVLKTAFRNGDDIHAITASQMFGVPVSDVSGDLRRSAKTINFGIIYGISAHGLAARLGIGRSEAASYIEQYFRQYPGIRDYMEATKDYARKHGYVETLYGRRCHLPGIHDKNAARRQFFERAAINAPLQGTAADIIKRAMIRISLSPLSGEDRRGGDIHANLQFELPPTQPSPSRGEVFKLLLQVHDELVFEVPEQQVEQLKPLIKKAMEGAASLSIPLTVEIGIGKHWGEAH